MFKNFDDNIELIVHEEVITGKINVIFEKITNESIQRNTWNRLKMNDPDLIELSKIYANNRLKDWSKELDKFIQMNDLKVNEKVNTLEKFVLNSVNPSRVTSHDC
jgi:hypothetical protein